MSLAAKIDATPMANLITALVKSPGDLAQMAALGRGIAGAQESAEASTGSFMSGITSLIAGAPLDQTRMPSAPMQAVGACDVSHADLGNFVAASFNMAAKQTSSVRQV